MYVDPVPDGSGGFSVPRVAIAVVAGSELLGSIWAAVPGPLTEERTQALRDSAKLVAMHLLRVRAGADVQRRVRTDLVSSALVGGVGASAALERLGLAGQRLLVAGVALDERRRPPDNPAGADDRQQLGDAFALHLSAFHPRAAAAEIGKVTYGLLPTTGYAETTEDRAMRILQDFLDRVSERLPAVVALGPIAADLTGLSHSRSGVDRVLRVLLASGDRRIGRAEEMQGEALALELRDLAAARGEQPVGGLARLIDYDRRHRSNLVPTLRAWLDAFGNIVAAADSVFVHQNTFRYRLRRVAEVGGIDLDDPDQRFAVMLQLRVLGP